MTKHFSTLTGAFLVAGAGLMLAACSSSGSSSEYKKSLSWMTDSEIQTLDQSKIVDTTGGEQANNVFEGLYRQGNNGQVLPGVAYKSQTSKDGLTWTFYLRKNAKWSNGEPVTAQNFVYSMRRTLDPKTASQQQNHFQAIKNAPAVVLGKKSPNSLGVEAKDKHTLVVHLTHPVSFFKKLTWNPENEKVVEKYGKKYGTASKYMVYNGPFVHKGWNGSNLTWKLEKNKDYWGNKDVKLNTVRYSVQKTPATAYTLYQSGKLDGTYLDTQASKQLKNQSGYRVFKLDGVEYLTFNVTKNKYLANTNVRRAISMALNRDELAKTVGQANTKATTFTGTQETVDDKNFNAYADQHMKNLKYSSYDPKEAKKYFDKALTELKTDKVELTLAGDDDDVAKKVMEFVQSQLEENLGKKMRVSVRALPKTTRVSNMLNGNYDMDYTGLTTDYTDPNAMLSVMATGENYNFGKWSNKKYDRALNASNEEVDESKRMKELFQAQQVLTDEQPNASLYYNNQAWMVKTNVHNLGFNTGSFNFRNTYVTE